MHRHPRQAVRAGALAWIVLVVVFTATLAGVGVRAAPGVMIVR